MPSVGNAWFNKKDSQGKSYEDKWRYGNLLGPKVVKGKYYYPYEEVKPFLLRMHRKPLKSEITILERTFKKKMTESDFEKLYLMLRLAAVA